MFDLTQLNDDDLRAALFDAVVERLDAQAQQDRSIAIVNRMPTVVAVSRRGNLLTLSQGLGPWLLRGDLKCRDRRERLKTFNVGRAALQSRLAITPDRIEGTPDEILDRIVAMFLESSAGAEESENRSVQERPAEERRPAVARTSRESRRPTVEVRPPASIEVTEDSSPVLQMPDQTISVAAVPPPPDPFQDKTRSALRTYQMLFETARRELDQAQSLPAGNRYFLLSAGVFVALSAEAFFNDLGSRVIPSGPSCSASIRVRKPRCSASSCSTTRWTGAFVRFRASPRRSASGAHWRMLMPRRCRMRRRGPSTAGPAKCRERGGLPGRSTAMSRRFNAGSPMFVL